MAAQRFTPPGGWLDIEVPLPFDPLPTREGEQASGGRREGAGEADAGSRAPTPELDVVERAPAQARLPMGHLTPLMQSARGDWRTPTAFFQRLQEKFHFLTDLAATAANAMLPRYLGPDHLLPERRDALALDWGLLPELRGLHRGEQAWLWLNPPYGRGVGRWLEQCVVAQARVGIVALLPARTDTLWFHRLVLPYARVVFLEGRLTFEGAPHAAPFPSMLAVYEPKGEGELWTEVKAASWTPEER